MDVVSGAASQIFFFFPQNPADVDGDQLDVSEASLGSKMLEKICFSRARESSFVRKSNHQVYSGRIRGHASCECAKKKKFSRARESSFVVISHAM